MKSQEPKDSWKHPATVTAIVLAAATVIGSMGTAFGEAITPVLVELVKRPSTAEDAQTDNVATQDSGIQALIEECSTPIRHLEDYSNLDAAIANISSIRDACNQVIIQKQANEEIYIDQMRASVILWEQRKLPQGKSIEDSFELFTKINALGNLSPKAKFYRGYIQDFKELVLSEPEVCPLAIDTYGDAIRAYKTRYDQVLSEYRKIRKSYSGEGEPQAIAPQENLSEEEAYILIEIGHWLNNRGKRLDIALDMYDIVLAHYSGASRSAESSALTPTEDNAPVSIEHNVLASKGVILFSKGEYAAATQMFESALEIEDSPELWGNLGASRAMSKEYTEAANAYETAIKLETDSDTPEEAKLYNMRLGRAYAFLLQGVLVDESIGQIANAETNYDSALVILDELLGKIDTMDLVGGGEYEKSQKKSLLYTALGVAYYYSNEKSASESNFLKALQWDSGSPISTNFLSVLEEGSEPVDKNILIQQSFFKNPIPHDVGHDPVLEVRHKRFYCGSADKRP